MNIRRIAVRSVLLGLSALTLAGSGARAADDEQRVLHPEFGIQAGVYVPDEDLTGNSADLNEAEVLAGPRLGYLFARRWGWFLDAHRSGLNTAASGDIHALAVRTGFEFFDRPYWKKLQWFFGLGGGVADFSLDVGNDFRRTFASVSAGQRVALDHRAHFRWELRADQLFDDNDVAMGESLTHPGLVIGVTWGLGRSALDSDGDGVLDRDDDCPGTPVGAVVDARGCPKDSDGDGVYDGIDKCPDTPRGAIVDAQGCPKDSDGDGVYDGIDKCPDTPRGAIVDAQGCPKDSDGDGVYDGIDKCPDTPRGTPVNADGCPKAAPLFEPGRRTLILEGVFFEFNKATLLPRSEETLDRVARSLLDWPEVRIEVAGHTDWIGSDAYNQDLSRRRAQAVREFLLARGVPAERMTAQGYGESRPIADNHSDEGRSKNRRVELRRLD